MVQGFRFRFQDNPPRVQNSWRVVFAKAVNLPFRGVPKRSGGEGCTPMPNSLAKEHLSS